MAGKDILRAESVVKILGDRVILYDASLDVKEGEIFGVIGPSGSGKTTLLRLLVGFFKPEKGDVLLRSSLVPGRQHQLWTSVSKHTDEVKRVFGFASQHPSIYMDLTSQENLEYFASLHGIPPKNRQKTADILLRLMDLDAAKETLGGNLSGGMQRRLDLACAMIHRPKVLILDEPTADLDPFLRRHIWSMIRKINEQGTTVIVSSHLLADVENLCDRVALVHRGKVIAVDSPDRIKRKYISTERIALQTSPGKYSNIRKYLPRKGVEDVSEEGKELIITSKEAEKILPGVLQAVHKAKENVSSIKVINSSLDEVFLQLAEEEKR